MGWETQARATAVVQPRALLPGLLLERGRELATLDALLQAAAEGHSRVALVEGPGGIGKSSLLAEAARRASSKGLTPLRARGGELERSFPFGVVWQLFEVVLVDDATRVRAMAGAAAAAAAVFGAAPARDGAQPDGDPSFASLHGLYWLTVNLTSAGPLVLLVDDLHWCDAASLRFMAYMARRLEGLPVLLLCSLRPSERVEHPLLIGELAADPATVLLRPRPLSEAATGELVRARLGHDADPAFSAACWSATGGNPLLLHELLMALEAEGALPDRVHAGMVAELGPRAVSRSVLVRLARLSEPARRLVRAAAVLGDDADLLLVTALAGVDEQDALPGVRALVSAEILRAGSTVSFLHPLVGAAVYDDIPPLERALEHARAARLLADAAAPAERIAAHLLAVAPHGESWVVATLLSAARASLARGAPDGAASYLRRALDEPPPAELRTDVLLELGRAEALISGPAAVEHLAEAHAALGDPNARAQVAQRLARTLLFTGRAQEGAAVARRAAAELGAEEQDLRQGLEAFEAMAVFFGAGDTDALERLRVHRSLGVPRGLGSKMMAAVAAQEWAYSGGSSAECAELALEALAGGQLIAVDDGFFGVIAITTLALADRREALDGWEASLADAHRRGSLFSKCAISLWRGFTLYWWGELDEAEQSLQTAARELELWGFGGPECHCAAFLASTLRERGRLADAWDALRLAADPHDGSEGARFWLDARLELLLAERRYAEVLRDTEEFERRFAFIRHPIDTPWRIHRALALAALGRRRDAQALAAEEFGLARAWGAPRTLARALRTLAALEPDAGTARLEEAVDAVADSPARLELAKSLAALGIRLRHGRRPREAREPLRRAIDLATSCGAAALAENARTELYAAGGRTRARTAEGAGALTASELRVAALAADGASNREIAETLFVTPKTVELHLGNTYRKLRIRSRHELAGALGDPSAGES